LAYRELFRNQVVGKLLIDIRQAANKGLVLGTKRYVKEVETLTG
jgi:putative transposase